MTGPAGGQRLYHCPACRAVWPLPDDVTDRELVKLGLHDIAFHRRHLPRAIERPSGCQQCRDLLDPPNMFRQARTWLGRRLAPWGRRFRRWRAPDSKADLPTQFFKWAARLICKFFKIVWYVYGLLGIPVLTVWMACSVWLVRDDRGLENSAPEALIGTTAFIVGGSVVAIELAKQRQPTSERDAENLSDLANFAGAVAVWAILGIGVAVMYMAGNEGPQMIEGLPLLGLVTYFVLGMTLITFLGVILKLAKLPGTRPASNGRAR